MSVDRYRHILTERQAKVLELKLAGHSYRTIAKALALHEATIRGHYASALDRIARHLEKTP